MLKLPSKRYVGAAPVSVRAKIADDPMTRTCSIFVFGPTPAKPTVTGTGVLNGVP